ncbi:MAG: hypothetical protein JNN30_02350 [Rhodanobacteraceae bacterium]|nr:hypothetical protein [Rhodanobacteraceae bacterium]
MHRLSALIAAALGLACGYGFTRYQAALPPAAPLTIPGAAATADPATDSGTGTDSRLPGTRTVRGVRNAPARPEHPLLAHAATLAPLTLPAARPGGPAELDALRRRAEQGDAAAAREWLQRDARCYTMLRLTPEAGARLPTPGFQRAALRGRSRLPALAPEVVAAAAIQDEAQRRNALAAAQQSLLDECRDYVPEPPQVRYALGEIAARLGNDEDFWRFINDPPFTASQSRDTQQAVDWARRAPAMVYARALSGDAQAALALGLSYAIDRPGEIDGSRVPRQLPAAIANDPLQAYRWLSVFLRSNPDADQAAMARALLNRVGAELDPAQRTEAERWSP